MSTYAQWRTASTTVAKNWGRGKHLLGVSEKSLLHTDNADLRVSAFYVLACISVDIKHLPVLLFVLDSASFN